MQEAIARKAGQLYRQMMAGIIMPEKQRPGALAAHRILTCLQQKWMPPELFNGPVTTVMFGTMQPMRGSRQIDGGYMAFGTSSNFATNGYADFYLLKLSNAGNIQWSHTFGGTYMDFGYDAMQASDGGYIMAGASFSFGSGFSFYTIKSDVNGNFQWGKAVNGFADEFAYGVTQTSDGGYIATGGTTGFGLGGTDVLLVKMASDGSVSWMKNYGGAQNDCGFTVRQTADGGYAVAGGTNSVGNGGYDLFLFKTDASGNLLWTKTYGGSADDGFTGGMFFSFSNVNADVSMITTNDGGFAITSQTNSFGAGHVYLIKTDSDGNSDCNETNGPFMEGVPTLSVMTAGAQTNPVQQTGTPIPLVTNTASKDSNVCCVAPTALVGNDVTICQASSATLTASGGGNYLWSTGATTASISVTPIISTTFVVTVSDSCGSDKDTVIVTVNPVPTAGAGTDVSICPGANVMLSGTTNAANYVWNPGGQSTSSITVSPTSTTTYTFSATNSCGTTSDSVTIVISNSIVANISGNLTICTGGSSTLTASGGTNYSWSTGSSANPIVVSPTTSATYSVIASSGTCADTVPVNVTVSAAPTAAIAASSSSICFGQSATLDASGGSVYSWNTGATTSSLTVSPTSTSSYSVVVSNGGCTDTAFASLIVTPSIVFTVTPSTICFGDSATVSATGGGTYLWNTGSTSSVITVSPTITSSYTVEVTSGVCTATAVATVNVSGPITAAISGNTTICSGSSNTLTASGGSSYVWSTGQSSSVISIAPTSMSSYSVIVSNGACKDTAYISVSVAPPININAPGAIICSGSSTSLSSSISGGTAPYSYSWSSGSSSSSITVSPTSTSNYTLSVTDAAGCSDVIAIPVTVLAAPVVGVTGNTSLCFGNSTTLVANGGVSYSWSSGSSVAAASFAPSTTTTYSVTGTDGNGCTKVIPVTITVTQPPLVTISGNDTVCSGNPSVLTATGGGSYLWNTGLTSSSITVAPTTATNYSVTVTLGGCVVSAGYSVSVIPSPTANAGANVMIGMGETTTLTATGGGTYSWSNGMSGQSISVNPTVTTQYCVIVTDVSGCSDSSCVMVFVKPMDCPEKIYVPNAFSPNMDNENDFFQVYFVNPLCIKTFSMKIYDRWGEEILITSDPAFKWDGVYKGMLQNSAVFTYYMYVQFVSGEEVTKKGNVSLVR